MNMLRKEWSEEEIKKLSYDLNVAKAKVFTNWGFGSDEISRIMSVPESVIRAMINKENKKG